MKTAWVARFQRAHPQARRHPGSHLRHIILVLAVIVLLQTAGLSQTTPGGGFVRGEVIVEIRPGISIASVNGRNGTTTLRRLFGTNIYRLTIATGQSETDVLTRLSTDPDVISAALNPLVTSPFTAFARSIMAFPDSHPTAGQARNTFLAQPLVEDLTAVNLRSTGNNILVAVIDTGIDRTHIDLQSRLWTNSLDAEGNGVDDDNNGLVDDFRGWDFFDNDNDPGETLVQQPNSISGHGTFIAGLISLIAPGARIMPIRAFGTDGTADAFSVASAIKYAADHHAQVINLSFGSPTDSTVLRDAIGYARQRGAVLVAALGNENADTDIRPQFPANYRLNVMGVAAIDQTGVRASFSNFGERPRWTPGGGVISTFPGATQGDYAMWSGTSPRRRLQAVNPL
jgi:subtilisin family serine protease